MTSEVIALYCNEPVLAAYSGERLYRNVKGADCFFDIFRELAYHVTLGYRIVLETEHYYLSLSVNGVKKAEKQGSIEDYAEPGEWFEPFIHKDFENGEFSWIEYESTLFVGERLLDVKEADGHFLLTFDDFVVRCDRCKKSMYAEMMAIDAINAWNEGYIDCDLSDIEIE